MTVSSEVSKSDTYTGNGSTIVFGYPFRIVDETHLRVVQIAVDGTVSDLIIGSDYTVSGVGDAQGGDITLSANLPAGVKLTIVRDPPLTQETALENQGAYHADTVEDRLDMSVMQIQAVKEATDRSLKVEPGQVPPDLAVIVAAEAQALAAAASANDADASAAAAAASEVNTAAMLSTKLDVLQPRVNVASAATTNIGAAASENVSITGSNAITAFDNVAAGVVRNLRFAGALTLSHNATSLILPNGGANIVTVAGDHCRALSLGGGNWVVTDYQRASGTPVAGGALLRVTQVTASGSFAPLPTTKRMHVRGCGGGGGGGGADGQATATATATSLAGNGGSHFDIWIDTADIAASYTCTIGAAGTAGAATGGNGGNGGDTTFTDGTKTVTVRGGVGGTGMVATATSSRLQATTAAADVLTGFIGRVSGNYTASNATIYSGVPVTLSRAGSSPFGNGGLTGGDGAAGSAGVGFGSGGGGATSTANNATNFAGGAGAPGMIEIEEYA